MLSIRLNLKHHCVETEIKRVYNRALSACLKNKSNDSELENRLEILQTALEEFDFPYLRSIYPDLAGNSSADIFLAASPGKFPVMTIEGRVIHIQLKDLGKTDK